MRTLTSPTVRGIHVIIFRFKTYVYIGLLIATKRNYLNILNLFLVQNNLNCNIVDAFSHACTFGNEEVVDAILVYRIQQEKLGRPVFDINYRDKMNNNFLMKASAFGYYR